MDKMGKGILKMFLALIIYVPLCTNPSRNTKDSLSFSQYLIVCNTMNVTVSEA